MANLDAGGVPGVFVATVEFEDGAQAQARALGADPAGVYLPHPIQDRTNDEMLALADAALEELLCKLVAPAA